MNFIESQKYLTWISEIFFFVPLHYDATDKRMKIKYIHWLLSLIVMIPITKRYYTILASQFHPNNNHIDSVRAKSSTGSTLIKVEVFISMSVTILVWLTEVVKARKQRRFINRMIEFDEMETTADHLPLNNYYKSLFRSCNAWIIFSFLFLHAILGTIYHFTLNSMGSFHSFGNINLFLTLSAAHDFQIRFIFIIVMVLDKRIEVINQKLSSLKYTNSIRLRNFNKLLDDHGRIYECFKQFEGAFGIIIMVNYIKYFTMTTIEVFYLYVLIHSSTSFEFHFMVFCSADTAWLLFNMYHMVMLIVHCHRASQRVSWNLNFEVELTDQVFVFSVR